MDHGGELWQSQSIREIAMQAGYHIEPAGSDAAYENGQVKPLNRTFASMVFSRTARPILVSRTCSCFMYLHAERLLFW